MIALDQTKQVFICIVVFFVLGFSPGYSQYLVFDQWEDLSGDGLHSFEYFDYCQNQQGEIITIGDAGNSEIQAGVVISKYTSEGLLIWQNIVGNEGSLRARCIDITPEGNYVVGGHTGTSAWCALFDNSGQLIWWDATIGPAAIEIQIRDLVVKSNGNIFLVGYIMQSIEEASDVLVIELNPDGSEPQYNVIGELDEGEKAFSVLASEADDIFVFGYTEHSISDRKFMMVRLDSTLTPGPIHEFPADNGNHRCYAATFSDDGNIVLAGNTSGNGRLIKVTAAGNEIWSTQLHESYSGDHIRSIVNIADGNYLVSGSTDWSEDQGFISVADSGGTEIWKDNTQYPGPVWRSEPINENSLILVGSAHDDSNLKSAYLAEKQFYGLSEVIVINEIMINPAAVYDTDGEWLELFSQIDQPFTAGNIYIEDEFGESVGPFMIDFSESKFFTMGNNADLTLNGGAQIDFEYDGMILNNNADNLVLIHKPDSSIYTIDEVGWDPSNGFEIPNGLSLSLVSAELENSLAASWRPSSNPLPGGDYGTPGAPNFSAIYEVVPAQLSFDTTTIGQISEQSLKLTNVGEADLFLYEGISSHPEFIVSINDNFVSPGDSIILSIGFSPIDEGYVAGLIEIETNATNTPVLAIPVAGVGVAAFPLIRIASDTIRLLIDNDLGIVHQSDISIFNDGSLGLEIQSFDIVENPYNFALTLDTNEVLPQDSTTLFIEYIGEFSSPFASDVLLVGSNALNMPSYEIQIVFRSTLRVSDILNPTQFQLLQNFPNPFNPTTTITYDLPEQSSVKLTVFDIQGKEVMMLQNAAKPPGNYEVLWNGFDQQGNQVSTGVYFARLQTGDYSKTIKMLYLK